MNNSKQESKNELKVISKIEVIALFTTIRTDHNNTLLTLWLTIAIKALLHHSDYYNKGYNTKPKGYDETVARNPAQLGYVHKALDKLIAELNTKFVPELDDVLHNNSNSISQLNDMLTEERSKLDELIKEINDLKSSLEPPPMDAPEFI